MLVYQRVNCQRVFGTPSVFWEGPYASVALFQSPFWFYPGCSFWNPALLCKNGCHPSMKHHQPTLFISGFITVEQLSNLKSLVNSSPAWFSPESFSWFQCHQIYTSYMVIYGYGSKPGMLRFTPNWLVNGYSFHLNTVAVDGRNLAPVDRWFIPVFIGFQMLSMALAGRPDQ